jgi:DNA-directed RNA polymerase III subunit RPC1
MRVDLETIDKLQLGLTMEDLKYCIAAQKKLKIPIDKIKVTANKLRVVVHINSVDGRRKSDEEAELFLRVQQLKRFIPEIVIKGYSEAQRAVINEDASSHKNSLLVEGYGLKDCMNTLGVLGTKTRTNSITEMREVLGIEAARKTIIDEIKSVMENMDIDPRHLQLLADVMTYKGEILGITRFGLAKMRDSVLQLASFEKTPDHLFDAAFNMKRDKIEGVSECIIMGQSMKVGTGAFQVVRELGLEGLGKKPTVFETEFRRIKKRRTSTHGLVV